MNRKIVLSTQRFLRLVSTAISLGIPVCSAYYWRRRTLNGIKAVREKDPVLFSFIREDYSNEGTVSSEIYSIVCSLSTSRKIASKLRDSYDVYEELPF